ncbi:hypothetical protein [Cronobacter sakazakii]|uniref:hypothetical protein n=1 Tax=Cronobacter sakazakii TaxID=28141 RepID=UPI0009BB5C76|nr:hypothetical protein [Cronobacter sakazakii]ELY4205791.1 hypothetical protein [Cronobacter sakazakii]ELY5812049.1 hypothetical protein [Cronobacter sakazakii]ELY7467753.1 hypothetical protein [Cronobacter sakazakii]ELZ1643724.1 hypothetical protein [Cronobacter sakazakii]PQV79362.1 hypothetical protein CDT91_04710 [Cronobacter sakazakii]
MDKSREQFLDWFSKEYEEVNNSAELSAQVIKMIASAAWQASRATVEIEIPEVLDYWLGREGFAESIRAAGLKVKGE